MPVTTLYGPSFRATIQKTQKKMTADWNLIQVLGDKPVSELVDGDVDSAVEFDQSGDYLATQAGDRGGTTVE